MSTPLAAASTCKSADNGVCLTIKTESAGDVACARAFARTRGMVRREAASGSDVDGEGCSTDCLGRC